MEEILIQGEQVLRTWQPSWTQFISAPLREEALRFLSPLNDLHWSHEGGHPGAERQRLLCTRCESNHSILKVSTPIHGLRVEGNFLFDKPSQKEMREALIMLGITSGGLGDIWICNDRMAQALCTPEAALHLNGRLGEIRETKISCESVEISQLQLPVQRVIRRLSSTEASKRIDAIASAGFGLSRAKVVNQIKEGRLRLNWKPVRQSYKELVVGDRIHLEGRGSLKVLSIELTKRQRWRVELLRQ